MLKWLWVTFIVIFLDQITKWMAQAQIEYTTQMIQVDGVAREIVATVESIPVISNLNWSLAYNYGAAFSIFKHQTWLLITLPIVVSIILLIWMSKLKHTEKWIAVSLSLVLGGAIGNLIDRILHGRVIDFIDVYADWDVFFLSKWNDGFHHFATFNIADIAINIGAVILVVGSFFIKDDA